MQRIVDHVNCLTKGNSPYLNCIAHIQDVRSAVSRLKLHKNGDGSCLSIHNFINVGDDCFTHIALLLTMNTVHGTVPYSFHVSTNMPISEGQIGNLSAVLSYYGKIYDNIVLSQQ